MLLHKSSGLAFLFCTCTLLGACISSGRPIDAGTIGDGEFENIVEQLVANHNLPALTVIVTENGAVVETVSTGRRSLANSTQVTEADQWQVGSVSKGITATLAARLVELGIVSWDTSIEDSFPEYLGEIHPDYRSVTLTDLLRHRSGLARELEPNDSEKSNIDRMGYSLRFLQKAPSQDRGSFRYSNIGYTLAGLMLGQATGLTYEDSLQQYLFTPLEISNYGIGYPDPGDDLSQPIGHARRTDHTGERVNDYWIPVPPNVSSFRQDLLLRAPAGGVYLSKDEYVKYLFLHLNGPTGESDILNADTFEYLHNPPENADYAMGWRVMESSGLERVSLSSSERVLTHGGNVGTWGAQSVILPDRKISLFMASNSPGTSALGSVFEDLMEITFRRLQITQ